MATSFRSRTFETATAQTAAWLLAQGARVVVRDDDARRRVVSLVQKRAKDGDDYERLIGQLRATGRGEPVDERELFAAAWKKKIIGITGPHGKTTTMLWAAHLIGDAITVDPATDDSVMSTLARHTSVALMESPPKSVHHAAVRTDGDYGPHQGADDIAERWGAHNVPNYLAAAHAARLAGISWDTIRRRSATLPQVPHCQEVVSRTRTLTVVDDGGARTAAQGIAALQRWGGPNCVLVAGGRGTGDYRDWADACAVHVTPNNTVFVAGSATQKMRAALGVRSRGIRTYDTLPQAWRAAKKRTALFLSAVLLYSPAAERIDTGAIPW